MADFATIPAEDAPQAQSRVRRGLKAPRVTPLTIRVECPYCSALLYNGAADGYLAPGLCRLCSRLFR